MDLRLSEEQELLVTTFSDLFASRATSARVREVEGTGHDAELWASLLEVGIVTMALPAAAGGWDATLLDLALIAELAGRAVAPAPIIESQVASRLLSRLEGAAARAALEACAVDGSIATVALHETSDGVARLVPAGAVARFVIGLSGDRLWLVDTRSADVEAVANLGAQPLADIDIGTAIALDEGAGAVAAHGAAVDEWLALTSAALVGVASRAQDMAVGYACERVAFGKPIGSFQAIAHPLADNATNLDGARLLSWEAAWAQDQDDGRFGELASMSFAYASETARDVTYHALHTLGGIGFTLEHDVQLHYRRARGWARVYADPRSAYRRAAAVRYAEKIA